MPSMLEWVAVALGIANIALLIRRSIWNYPFALAMVTLYAFIFYEAKLYSDTLLQGFFLRPALIGAGIQPIGQGPLRGLCPRQRTCSLQPRCVRRPVLRRTQHAPPSRTKRKTSRHRRNGGRR